MEERRWDTDRTTRGFGELRRRHQRNSWRSFGCGVANRTIVYRSSAAERGDASVYKSKRQHGTYSMMQPKERVWGKNINTLGKCSAVLDIPLGAHLGPAVQFEAFSGQLPARSLCGVRGFEIIRDQEEATYAPTIKCTPPWGP